MQQNADNTTGQKRRPTTEENFWTRSKGSVLSVKRVKETLDAMGASPTNFSKKYLELATAGGRTRGIPLDSHIAAVESFQKTGNFNDLEKALGVKMQAAQTTIVRVLQYQAAEKLK